MSNAEKSNINHHHSERLIAFAHKAATIVRLGKLATLNIQPPEPVELTAPELPQSHTLTVDTMPLDIIPSPVHMMTASPASTPADSFEKFSMPAQQANDQLITASIIAGTKDSPVDTIRIADYTVARTHLRDYLSSGINQDANTNHHSDIIREATAVIGHIENGLVTFDLGDAFLLARSVDNTYDENDPVSIELRARIRQLLEPPTDTSTLDEHSILRHAFDAATLSKNSIITEYIIAESKQKIVTSIINNQRQQTVQDVRLGVAATGDVEQNSRRLLADTIETLRTESDGLPDITQQEFDDLSANLSVALQQQRATIVNQYESNSLRR